MSNIFDGKSGLVMSSSSYTPATETRESLEERHDRERFEHAKAEREATEAKLKEAVEAAMPLSMKANAQLQAQRMGIVSQCVRTEDVGAILSKAEIERTPVKVFGNMEVSYKQAKDMLDVGQITRADFNRAVADGLAARGYAAPASFR